MTEHKKEPNIKCERCLNMLNPSAFVGRDKVCIGCRRTEEAGADTPKPEYKGQGKNCICAGNYGMVYIHSELCPEYRKPEPQPKDWEERFDEKLYPNAIFEGGSIENKIEVQKLLDEYVIKVKSFIRQTLKEARDEAYEEGYGVKHNALMADRKAVDKLIEDTLKEKSQEIEEAVKSLHEHHYAEWKPTEEQKGYRKAQIDMLKTIKEILGK